MKKLIAVLSLGALIVPALPASAGAADGGFSGKPITVIVAFSAGGPVDVFARLIAAHVGRHIPGNPNIVVQNMPGAGGVVAANHLYNIAKKDGSVFGVTISPFTNQYLGKGKARFDTAEFYWLGALNISQAIYVNDQVGVKSLADLVNTKKQIVVGGLSPTASRDLRMRSFLEALGIRNYKYVTGYRGTRPIRHALQSNEVNLSDESVVALATDLASDVKAGKVVPLAQSGLTRNGERVPDPRVPMVPIAQDAIIAVKGEAVRKSVEFRAMVLVESMVSLGRAVFAPPGIDPAAGKLLRDAVGKLNKDSAFQKDARRLTGGTEMELIAGATAQRFAQEITGLVKSDPEAIAYLENKAKRKK